MTYFEFDRGECVGCEECRTPPIYCKMCRVEYTVCDICGRETDGSDLCESCIKEMETDK